MRFGVRMTEKDKLGRSNPVTYTLALSNPNSFLISFSTYFVAVAVKAPTIGLLGSELSHSPMRR